MSSGQVLAIAIPALIILVVVVGFVSVRRRDEAGVGRLSRETRVRDAAAGLTANNDVEVVSGREVERAAALARIGGDIEPVKAPPAPEAWSPPDLEALAVTRRQFLNRSSIGLMILGLSGFGAASLAFLWPKVAGGFGSKVIIGAVSDVEGALDSSQPAEGFSYFAEAQSYIQRYPADAVGAAEAVYKENIVEGMRLGYVALWQKCPHLGCKVPACGTSQWFECPCHGSQYNRVGEKKAGPAPRGLDRFPIEITEDGDFVVNTAVIVQGPAIGTDTTNQGLEGPHCTSGGHA
jgi:cytochrome b6-f complex iron-sulfur subunit